MSEFKEMLKIWFRINLIDSAAEISTQPLIKLRSGTYKYKPTGTGLQAC